MIIIIIIMMILAMAWGPQNIAIPYYLKFPRHEIKANLTNSR